MNGLMNNVFEIGRVELILLKDVLLAVKDRIPRDDYIQDLDEAIDLIDDLLYTRINYND